MSVQALDGGSLGETSNESSSTELGGTGTRCKDGTDSNVFDDLGIDTGAVDQTLEDTSEDIGGGGILEATLAGFGDGGTEGTGDDDVIGVLLGESGGS